MKITKINELILGLKKGTGKYMVYGSILRGKKVWYLGTLNWKQRVCRRKLVLAKIFKNIFTKMQIVAEVMRTKGTK